MWPRLPTPDRRCLRLLPFLLVPWVSLACASDPWLVALEAAEIDLMVGDHGAAAARLGEALALAEVEDLEHHSGSRRALTLEALGDAAHDAGRPEDALDYYERAFELREARYDEDDPKIAIGLAILAPALARSGRGDEAARAAERFDALWQPRRKIHDSVLAGFHRDLGEGYLDAGDAKTARAHFERSLEERQYAEGSDRHDVAFSWEGYARALRALGDEAGALEAEARAGTILADSSYFEHALLRGSNLWVGVSRWPEKRMPLPVKLPLPPEGVEDREALRAAAREAVLSWTDVVRPGVPSFRFVEGRFGVAIRVSWEVDVDDPMRIGHARPGGLRAGALRFVSISIPASAAGGRKVDASTVRAVTAHEIGHALGIWGHSPNAGDLMFARMNDALEPTARDRNTLRELYRYEPGEQWQSGQYGRW